MICQPISQRFRILYSTLAFILIIACYGLLSARQHSINSKDTSVPNLIQFWDGFKMIITPEESAQTRAKNLERGYLYAAWHSVESTWLVRDTITTFSRLFMGMAIGITLAVVIGVLMGCYGWADAFFGPALICFSKVPPTAMLAVYLILLGTGLNLYLGMIALGIFPALAMSIAQTIRKDINYHELSKAYTLGASECEVITNVVIPSILPKVIEAIRLQIGPALIFLIAVEWSMSDGFGYRLKMQSRLVHMNVVYLYLMFLACAGYAIERCLRAIRQSLCPWFGA